MVPVLLVAVALIAMSASGAGGDARAEIEYLNEMSAQVETIALGGESLRSIATRLSTIDRPELVVVIDDLSSDLAAAMEFANQEPPSTKLFAVRSLYRLALRAWDSGAGNFGEGVLAAADNPGDPAPVDTIANSIVSMRSGDRLFTDLLFEIDRVDVRDPITPLRSVALSPGDGPAVSLAVSYSLAARSATNGLALRPGLGISQLVASPEWQLSPDDLVIMPATEEATFSAVVSNTGNLVSADEQIVLTFTGAADPIEIAAVVPPLEPGAQTTVAFEPISVVPGQTYEVMVEIIVSDIDASFEDNIIQVTFRVNTE